jgi:hypothetical protein
MSTITTIQSSDLITNSRAVINDNFSNLNTDKEEVSNKSTDTTMAANSDTLYPSQAAVKAYVDGVGVATATTTIKGLVEIATQAQVTAGTATGETGASIVVTPETLMGITTPVVRTYLNSGSPHTWTKPTGLKYVVVEVVGGGGGGQGAASSSDASGGGGGAGGYSRKVITASSLGATETVTTGAGGAGGVSGNLVVGTVGGTSSFGAHASAVGGGGGTSDGASGGTASGGDLNITGNQGSLSAGSSAGTPEGGAGALANAGAGGRGGADEDDAGQAGYAGIVIVTEYYV